MLYVFILKETNEIYACTDNRKYKNAFKSSRNMSKFTLIKKEGVKNTDFVDSNEWKLKYIDLWNGKRKIKVIATNEEISTLHNMMDYIIYTVEEITTENFPIFKDILDEDELKVIFDLTKFISESNEPTKYLIVNSFELFYHLFEFSFSNNKSIQDLYKIIG